MQAGYTLERVIGAILPVGPDRAYPVETRAARLGRQNFDEVGPLAATHFPIGHLLLLADHHTYPLGGATLERVLRLAGFAVHCHLLPDAHIGRVEADEETVGVVEALIDALPGPRAGVIALGAGTLNDLAKLASFRKNLPYGVVATAASMNGYTSAIAAILADGVKRTIACRPPRFVLADLEIVAAAPKAMTLAGLGDLLSKPVSGGDWRLAHCLLGEAFYQLPIQLVEDVFSRVQKVASAIGEGDPEAIGHLLEALLLSGISMASAGSSSPASGGEHLISHLWDMTSPWRGRHPGLHGAQVAVATLITATLYQHLKHKRPTAERRAERLQALEPFDVYARRLDRLPHALLPPVLAEARSKYPSPAVLEARLQLLDERWEALWQDLDGYLQSPARLRRILLDAGAPTTAKELGIPEHEVREAFRLAKDIRGRYTVLDLAWELGVLESLEELILNESGVLEED